MRRAKRKDMFITPERASRGRQEESDRGDLLIASCRAGAALADKVARRYAELLSAGGSASDVPFLAEVDSEFTDTETRVRLETEVNGRDVFLFQSLYTPGGRVDEHYAAFHIAARAFRENGARHVTGVLPYLAYARQDKPTRFRREPTTAALMAELTMRAGIDRLVTWHPHSRQVKGFYGMTPVDILEPLGLFADMYRDTVEGRERDFVVVSPDTGASKLATHLGRLLGVKSAVVSKRRTGPDTVELAELIGDLRDAREAIVVDDMVSGGGTLYETVRHLARETGIDSTRAAVSHNLCVGEALARFKELHSAYGLREVVVTDSIPQTVEFVALPFTSVTSLDDILCRAVNAIHYDRAPEPS